MHFACHVQDGVPARLWQIELDLATNAAAIAAAAADGGLGAAAAAAAAAAGAGTMAPAEGAAAWLAASRALSAWSACVQI